ncbi:MAG TPA: helicase C-terminal domain-containing protein [Polyangia bacterium]|nr:helicase C-terminal domain-containing protein [Polyangia bacterium]
MIREIFGDGGVLARALPGYEPRPQQLAMAQAVLAALREQRPTVVEAGTGTGKTIAYLVPAILSGLKIIISTGTKTLQEQIYCKDIPLLQKMLPVPFTAAYMKGITNYLCLRRFKEAGVTDARIVEWAARTETGDRAELADLPEDAPIWEQIQSTPETRLGLRCMLFEDCFVTRMRRRAQQANLVIVNHHLFFADLALRATWPQAQVLPTYEAAIFDEAHGLEEVATEYFGVQVSSYRLQTLARDLAHREPAQAQLAHRIDAAAQALFDRVRRAVGPEARGRVPAELWHGETLAAYHTLDNVLDQAAAHFGQYPDDVAVALGTRAQLIRNELALLAEQKSRSYVYWMETRGRGTFLHASPVEVGPILRENLVAQVSPLVFTSATLSVGSRFDYFRERVGLDQADDTACLQLRSPFDYARQAMLYVPRDLPDPQAADFIAAAARRMVELLAITHGRAFLLFTSYRNLRAAEQVLRAAQLPYPLLVQGERPRGVLLDAFRKQIGSVLVATASFWEGVDVIGEALQLVVIDKLPFAPPDDPIGAARIELLRAQGRDPFRDYQVPQAALMLKQGFGRLIRHREDRGIVAVLDRRLLTRGYGRIFLRSLPPECPQSNDLAEVQAWWRQS